MNAIPSGAFLRCSPRSQARATRVPLSIYVMWHPSFAEGESLARDIYEWFGGRTGDARAVGLGIPVHFRSAPWENAMALNPDEVVRPSEATTDPRLRILRRPVNLQHAEHNVFVPLVDDHMVDDPSWRRDLLEIASHCSLQGQAPVDEKERTPPFVDLLPVQISPSWSRLPAALTKTQALFLRRWTDASNETLADRLARWRVRLRRLLTQAIVRLLRERRAMAPGGGAARPGRETILPTEVFLSHAKMDQALGPGVAEQLRDAAAGYGQIDVFYDENDLPSAATWSDRLLDAAGGGAGFIAVLSDGYATRYWCRREVEQARTPRQVTKQIWAVRPTVVAVTLAQSWSRLVPDLSTVPAIAWNKDRAPEILDQLFLEALVAEFQLLYAQGLHESLTNEFGSRLDGDRIAYMTWTPDAASVLRLYRAQRDIWKGSAFIAYPGHGFLPTEEEDIALSLGPGVRFISYEELADSVARGRAGGDGWPPPPRGGDGAASPLADWPLIALSAGDSDDLAARGYDAGAGSVHVDAAVLRFCRALLEGHVRIAYGGTLRDGKSFASLLHDVVTAMSVNLAVEASPDPTTALENYVAAPYWVTFDVAMRASLAGLAKFIRIGENAPPGASDGEKAVALATALSETRRAIARTTRATIALGGKRFGFSGFLPGVAEEVLCAMESLTGPDRLEDPEPEQVRVVLIGEFGGVTRALVQYVLGNGALPNELTLAGQAAGSQLLAQEGANLLAAARYADARRCLDGLRSVAILPEGTELPALGLTVGEWKAVMTTSSPSYIRRLLKDRIAPRLHRPRTASPTT